jgi:hypothetical protein
MKYDPSKSFGYPVLSQDNDDYVKASFQASFSFDLDDEDPSRFKLKYKFDCSVKEIRDLITAEEASYWIKVYCRSTFYTKMHEVGSTGDLLIDGTLVRDTVDFSGYIIGKKEAILTSSKINAEFGYQSFRADNGQILALTPPITYFTEKEFWKPISSIFEYSPNDELKNGEFSVDIELDFVQIYANSSQLNSFTHWDKSPSGRIVLLNTVFFSALCKMIEAINEKPDDYREKKWARVLEAKAAAKRFELNERLPFIAAQRLLDRPLTKLADAFLEK